MTITLRIEPCEFKRAAWLHMKPRKSLAIVGVLLVILALVVLGITGYGFVARGQDLWLVLIMGGSLTYLCIYFFVCFPHRLARLYQQQKLLHEEFTMEISDTHLVTRSRRGEITLPWELFHKWKSDKRMVLLYQSDALFHVFPRRVFASPDEFQSLQTLLKNKLGPAKV